MSETDNEVAMRLSDDELEALIERFSPGRHSKVAAALAELKEFRGGERQRCMDVLLDGASTYIAEGLAKEFAARWGAIGKPSVEPDVDEMTARRQAEVGQE